MKECKECHRELPTSSFHKDKTNKDRLRTRCKDCRSKIASLYWEKNWKRKTLIKRLEYAQLKKEVLLKLGNKCFLCGFSDPRALQIDHVNGGGSKVRLLIKRNWHKFYREVLIDKSGLYQLLCANCNWIKRYEKKESDSRRYF